MRHQKLNTLLTRVYIQINPWPGTTTMSFLLPKKWGLTTSMVKDAVWFNLKALTNDKAFCFFLAASAVGVGSVAVPVVRRLKNKQKKINALLSKREKRAAANSNDDEAAQKKSIQKNKRKKKKNESDLNLKFWARLWKMLKIAVPNYQCESFRLLVVQFLFLVLRALLTVRLTQINVQLLTEAISRASWSKWARWLVNFVGWMGIGISTNSALHFVEKCLQVALRKELTVRAHTLYMRNNFFYDANVMQSYGGSSGSGGLSLDNLDQRITSDVEQFCFEVVQLYGHSFKPLLEFVLSLSAAMHDIGPKRPLAMFGWFFVVGGIISISSPRIGSVVAQQQSMEGEFRRVHSRLIAHAEEIAFLKGSSAECALLNRSFDDMVTTFGGHNLKFLWKKMFDEFLKFQAPLVGGIAVHVPFLLRPTLDASERITQFRSTETIMLKSGSAFGETMLLHKRFQRVSGFTRRIAELFEALESSNDESSITEKERRDVETSLSDRVVGDRIEFVRLTVAAPEPISATIGGGGGGGDELEGGNGNGSEIEEGGCGGGGHSSTEQRRLLVRDLNLSIPPGTNIMVTGPNGCRKTSLFRVLAGLWPAVSGQVIVPPTNVMWLPQRPYLVLGNLRDQVTYPLQFCVDKEEALAMGGTGRVVSKEEDINIIACLRKAGLDRFVDQELGEWSDGWWCFARILFFRQKKEKKESAVLTTCSFFFSHFSHFSLLASFLYNYYIFFLLFNMHRTRARTS